MLTKKTPDEIKARLTHKAMGVENTIMLTYHNHSPEVFEAFIKNPETMKIPEGVTSETLGIAHINAAYALFVVKSFDDGTADDFPLTRDGLIDLEQHWPGTLIGIVQGYHRARGASVEKN